MSEEVNVTSENFEKEILKSEIPVLVDFWAEWCVPCVKAGPIVEEIAEAHKGKIKVAKVNVDSESEVAAQYGITSIPTFMVFKDGEKVKQQIGAGSREAIESIIKEYIS